MANKYLEKIAVLNYILKARAKSLADALGKKSPALATKVHSLAKAVEGNKLHSMVHSTDEVAKFHNTFNKMPGQLPGDVNRATKLGSYLAQRANRQLT